MKSVYFHLFCHQSEFREDFVDVNFVENYVSFRLEDDFFLLPDVVFDEFEHFCDVANAVNDVGTDTDRGHDVRLKLIYEEECISDLIYYVVRDVFDSAKVEESFEL